jgi:hypothetical protein
MRTDDVEDDLEELRAARARMMRPEAVWLHRIAHVLQQGDLPAPAGGPAKENLGFDMTEDPYCQLMKDYGDVLKGGAEYGPGWIQLVRRMLDEMIGALKAAGFQRADLRIMQMKEKRGTLRCYYRAPLDLERIVDKYEDKSAVICEQCGALGHMRNGMYITCICDSCARKYKVEESASGSLIRIGDYLRKLAPQPGFMPDRDMDAEADAQLEEQMRRAREQSSKPMATAESIQRGEIFIKQAREVSAKAIQMHIEKGNLVSCSDLKRKLHVDDVYISRALAAGRLFAIADSAGALHYPAFYADPAFDRDALEAVIQQLGDLPATVKFHFFISAKLRLRGRTPLQELKDGRLNDVLRVATACREN